MQAERDAKEDAPQDETNSSLDAASESPHSQQCNCQKRQRHPVVFTQQDLDAILGKIRSVVGQGGCLRVKRSARDNPAHMCPPRALLWRVWVSFAVAVLVVDTVGRHPRNRSALQCE